MIATVRTEPKQLEARSFDVVVVGAGIQGAAVARDAALRGLSVLLVEARDFAAGTSSRSSRLVHGGLRYLRHGHFALVREALHERERLLRLCPHLVRPLPMLMPFFRDGGGSRWQLRLGTWLYQQLAGRSTLPGPRALSADRAIAAFPGLRRRGLRSALVFFDAVTQDTRLVLANVLAAHQAAAVIATHTEVIGARDGALLLRDRLAGVEVEVRTAHVVNATGPRADALRRRLQLQGPDLVRTSRGSHLILPPRDGELALAAFLPDQRIQFVVPHEGGTLCGTTDVDDPLPGDETGPPQADLDYLLQALAFLLDPAPKRRDVRFGYAGWRSLPCGKGPPGALNREAFVVDEAIAGATLHTIVGGKLTTHRALAERVVAKIFGRTEPSPTRTEPLPGGAGARDVGDPLWWRHGSRAALVHGLIARQAGWALPLCPHRPFLIAEAVAAIRHDGAVTFADLMLRRLVHSSGPCMQLECLLGALAVFQRERLWPVDGDPAVAVAALQDEVAAMRGDVVPGPGAMA